MLEGAGYVTGVACVDRGALCSKGREVYKLDVAVKAPGEPLDLHRAASMLASTLFFRGAMLRFEARHAPVTIDAGICWPGETDTSAEPGYDFTACAGKEIKNAADARAWVAAQLAAICPETGAQ